jgi:hypothetical protein
MSIDWKCTITVGIITVLIYLLMCSVFKKSEQSSSKETEWWAGCEALVFYSVVIAYNLNQSLFGSCKM